MVSEIRFLMQPVTFLPRDGLNDGSIKVGEKENAVALKVINRYTFRDLSHLSWTWELKSNQGTNSLCTGRFDVAQDQCLIRLDKALPKIHQLERARPLAGNSYFLNIRGSLKSATAWSEEGHTLVTQQLPVTLVDPPAPVLAAPSAPIDGSLKVTVSDADVQVWRRPSNGDEPVLLAAIERDQGSLCHYAPHGRNVLVDGIRPNFTRATTENDRGGLELALNFLFPGFLTAGLHGFFHGSQDFSYWSRWRNIGLSQEAPPTSTCVLAEVTYCDDDKVDVDVVCHIQSSTRGCRLLFTVTTHYTVYRDGSIRLATLVSPSPVLRRLPSIARVGVTFQLNPQLHRVQYFGRGPEEVSANGPLCLVDALPLHVLTRHFLFAPGDPKNYPDRKSGSELGVYDTSPSSMGYSYVVPTENGSRSDCRWIAFRSLDDGTGLCVAAENVGGSGGGPSLSCSALLHRSSELEAARHTCDLEVRQDGVHPIHCCVDHAHMGLGGDTRYVGWNAVAMNIGLGIPCRPNLVLH